MTKKLDNYLENIWWADDDMGPKERVAFNALQTVNLIMISYVAYRDFLSKTARACNSKYKVLSTGKYICMKQGKILALQKQISVLKTNISKCSKTKKPEKCVDQLKKKISKTTEKINKANLWIKKASKKNKDKTHWGRVL